MGDVSYSGSHSHQRVWVGSQAEVLKPELFITVPGIGQPNPAEHEDKVGSHACSQTHGQVFCRLLPPVILQAILDSIILVLQIRH